MADASGIRAGRAFIELGAVDTGLRQMLDAAAAKLRSFGQSIQAVGVRLAAFGTAALAGLGVAISQFADVGAELERMSQRTGFTVESLSALRLGAAQVGTDLATVEGAIKSVERAFIDAAGGAAGAQEKLASLGLRFQQLLDLSPEQRFGLIAEQLSKIPNPAERAARSLELLGTTALNPLLKDGLTSLRALGGQAGGLGVVFDRETTRSAQEFAAALAGLRLSVQAIAVQVGAALAPALKALMSAIVPAITATVEWVRANRDIVIAVGAAAGAVTLLGGALVGLGLSLRIAAVGLAGFSFLVRGPLRLAMLGFSLVTVATKAVLFAFTATVKIASLALSGLSLSLSVARAGVTLFSTVLSSAQAAVSAFTAAVTAIGSAAATLTSLASGFASLVAGLSALIPLMFGGVTAFIALKTAIGVASAAARGAGSAFTSLQTSYLNILAEFDGATSRTFAKMREAASSAWASIKSSAMTAWAGISDAIRSGDYTLAFQIGIAGMRVAWLQLVAGMTSVWESFKLNFTTILAEIAVGAVSAWADISTSWVDVVSELRTGWQEFYDFIRGSLRILAGQFKGLSGLFSGDLKKAAEGFAEATNATPFEGVSKEERKRKADEEKAQIEEVKQKRITAIIRINEAVKKDAADNGPGRVKAALEELEAAERKLQELREKARPLQVFGPPKPEEIGQDVVKQVKKFDVVGTFNARLAGQMGAKTVPEQQLTELKKINENGRQQLNELKKGAQPIII